MCCSNKCTRIYSIFVSNVTVFWIRVLSLLCSQRRASFLNTEHWDRFCQKKKNWESISKSFQYKWKGKGVVFNHVTFIMLTRDPGAWDDIRKKLSRTGGSQDRMCQSNLKISFLFLYWKNISWLAHAPILCLLNFLVEIKVLRWYLAFNKKHWWISIGIEDSIYPWERYSRHNVHGPCYF